MLFHLFSLLFLFSLSQLIFFPPSDFVFSMGFPPPSVFFISPVLAVGDFGALGGDFLSCVTLVHPSSSLLLGLSPVSFGGIFSSLFVGADDTGVVLVKSLLMVLWLILLKSMRSLLLLLLCWWFFVGMIWKNDQSVCSASTVASGSPLPPSWIGLHNPMCGVLPENLLYSSTLWKSNHHVPCHWMILLLYNLRRSHNHWGTPLECHHLVG